MYRVLAIAALYAGLASASLVARNTTEPCALVAQSISTQSSSPYRVDGNLALACLRSVPLDTKNSPDLVKTFRAFTEFQSNLAHLKQGLPGSLYPPVDLLGGLDDIIHKLEKGQYTNEYDLHFDLFAVSKSGHDFHYNYAIDILNVFSWNRAQSLVSISSDGIILPDIYLYHDAMLIDKPDTKVSPITKINGVVVETWINDYANLQPYDHDPDASYNKVLWNNAATKVSEPDLGLFASTTYPQHNQTILTFANGTIMMLPTYAETTESFKGVTNGQTFFDHYCSGPRIPDKVTTTVSHGPNNSSASTTRPALAAFTSITAQNDTISNWHGFPRPYVFVRDSSLAGFLPSDQRELAVLKVPSFAPGNETMIADFQNAVRGLLATAQAQGRKKLIIDIRGNSGGIALLGFDFFRNIFPDIIPYSANVDRSSPAFREIVRRVHKAHTSTAASQRLVAELTDSTVVDIDTKVDKDNVLFTSLESFYGPFPSYGDNFTAPIRYDLRKSQPTDVQVLGYGSNNISIPQVFQPNDIVILSDGLCGSACSDVAEFFKSQAHVKTIVVGGRKQNGPMQAVGGTKGGEVITLQQLGVVLNAVKDTNDTTIDQAALKPWWDIGHTPGAVNLVKRSGLGKDIRVNFQNNIRINDTTITPLQYIYEAADCRFFYTADMLRNQSLVWKMVFDIRWGNATCVPGSADHPSSLSGKLLSYVDSYPPIGANFTFGSNSTAWPKGVANSASTNAHKTAPILAASTGKSSMATGTTYLDAKMTASSSVASTSTTTSSALPSTTLISPSTASPKPTSGANSKKAASSVAGLIAVAALLVL